eukprot:scaffold114578_cov77-Cyclotella_meneghiniana.AAC.1
MPGKYLIKLEGFGGYGRADAFANHCRTCRLGLVMKLKSKVGSRRFSTQKYCGKAIESDA